MTSRKNRSRSRSSASSKRWLQRQSSDGYVRQARQSGYRSRAAFKLQQLDERDRLVRPGMVIVDLGAAPGGWSQFAAEKLVGKGEVIAIDRLEMTSLKGVQFIQGDFLDPEVLRLLEDRVQGRPVDLVLSDLAPNLSGIREADEARSLELLEAAREFAGSALKQSGNLVAKGFEGAGMKAFVASLKRDFQTVNVRKPDASRSESREIYLVAKGYNRKKTGA